VHSKLAEIAHLCTRFDLSVHNTRIGECTPPWPASLSCPQGTGASRSAARTATCQRPSADARTAKTGRSTWSAISIAKEHQNRRLLHRFERSGHHRSSCRRYARSRPPSPSLQRGCLGGAERVLGSSEVRRPAGQILAIVRSISRGSVGRDLSSRILFRPGGSSLDAGTPISV
jgi:hypothetical protein